MSKADLQVGVKVNRGDFNTLDRYFAQVIKRGEALDAAVRRTGITTEAVMKAYADRLMRLKTAEENLIKTIAAKHALQKKQGQTSSYKKEITALNKIEAENKKIIRQLQTRILLYERLKKYTHMAVPWQTQMDKSYASGKAGADAFRPGATEYATKKEKQLADALRESNRQRVNAETATNRQRIENEKLNKSLQKTSKHTGILNNNFAKFSIYMSGIAATLFVFQQAVAWINAAVEKLTKFETAVRNLQAVTADGMFSEEYLRDLRKNTPFKVDEAASTAKTLTSQGYNPTKVLKNLNKVLGYTSTGFVDVSQAMEIATTDVYNLSDKMDYYSKQMASSTEYFWNELSNQFERFVTVIAETGKVLAQSDNPIIKALRFAFSIPGAFIDVLETAHEARKREVIDFQNKATVNYNLVGPNGEAIDPNYKPDFRYDYDSITEATEKFFKDTGEHVGSYFLKKRNELTETTHPRELGIFKQIGASDDAIKQLVKQQKHELLKLTWDEIYSKDNPLNNYETEQLEKTFKSTGYYDPRLKTKDELERQRDYGLSIGSKDAKGYDWEKHYSASLTKLNETIEDFIKENKLINERGESLFDKYSIMTPEYQEYKKSLSEDKYEYRLKANNPNADLLYQGDLLDQFKDNNERMFEDQEFLYNRTGKLSKEYYDKQKKLIKDERDLWIKTGYDKTAAQQEFMDRMNELNDKYHRTAAQGFESAIRDMRDKAKDSFDQMKDMTTLTFDSMETAISKFVKTGKFEWEDFVTSILDGFIKIATQQWLYGNDKSSTGGLAGLLQMGVSALFNSPGGAIEPGTGLVAGANGMVFSSGHHLSQYATGGIVTKPILFPMANGAGLMGEAGPEAILPLTRVGGDLGVKAQTAAPTINLTVNENQPKTEVKQQQQGNITEIILNLASRDVAGRGSFSRTLEATYGLSRVGRRA